jgi:hypothetical protein
VRASSSALCRALLVKLVFCGALSQLLSHFVFIRLLHAPPPSASSVRQQALPPFPTQSCLLLFNSILIFTIMARRKKTGTSSDGNANLNARASSNVHWTVTSSQYLQFVEICVKMKWDNRQHLPRRGSQDARELDTFSNKGMGDDRPFSRAQLNRKFDHWKESLQSEQVIRRLDDNKIETTLQLFARVQKTDLWLTAIRSEKISLFDDEACSYDDIFKGDWLFERLYELRDNLIIAFNETLSQNSNRNSNSAEVAYVDCEVKLVQQFVDDAIESFMLLELVKNSLEVESAKQLTSIKPRARAFLDCVALEFVQYLSMAIKRGCGDGGQTLSEIALQIVAEYTQEGVDITEDTLLTRTIYNIAGWLVRATEKKARLIKNNINLRSALNKVAENAVATNALERQQLPTGKVDTTYTTISNALRYPSEAFFRIVLIVERVCERVLIERSVLIYGSQVVDELTEVLADTPAIRSATKICSGNTLDDIELDLAVNYLTSTYMKMRARDFVRQLMGKTRKSLQQGTRPTLGAIASGVCGGKVKPNVALKKTPTCFFCGQVGHRCPDCPAISIPPTNRVTCRTVDFLGQDTFVWHWCLECKKWRTHKTANHPSLDFVEQTVLDDSDDDSLVGEIEEMIEMENAISDL